MCSDRVKLFCVRRIRQVSICDDSHHLPPYGGPQMRVRGHLCSLQQLPWQWHPEGSMFLLTHPTVKPSASFLSLCENKLSFLSMLFSCSYIKIQPVYSLFKIFIFKSLWFLELIGHVSCWQESYPIIWYILTIFHMHKARFILQKVIL